jgi:SAM-dependent methyltransferase
MTDTVLDATRAGYDVLAVEHTETIRWDPTLGDAPLDRAMLGLFAEWSTGKSVVDVGCGSGRVTRYLADLGLDVSGIDLSPEMIALARRLYPDLRFEVGSMTALDLPDASVGGLLGYFSIIHVPWEHRARVFAEFRRVLTPGGYLMLTFQVGDERRRRDEVDGRPIPPLDWYRQRPDEVVDLLAAAGFELRVRAVLEPEPGTDGPPAAHLLARAVGDEYGR